MTARAGGKCDTINPGDTSMAWQRAASLKSIPEDGVLGVELDGAPLALYNLDGRIYATHGICTHVMAILAEGWIEDGKIECPLHQGQFDIRSGKALCSPVTEDLRTYAVRVDGNDILVDVSQPGAASPLKSAATNPLAAENHEAVNTNRIVIVGAGQAAAAAIRAMRTAGFNGSIDLVGAEPHLPYERPPLSKELLLGKADASSGIRLSEEDAVQHGVNLHLGLSAISLDPMQ